VVGRRASPAPRRLEAPGPLLFASQKAANATSIPPSSGRRGIYPTARASAVRVWVKENRGRLGD